LGHGALVGLAAIIVLGIAAQWLAWRLGLPAILLLLIAGFAVGPATGFLQPDHLFGETLFPAVSVAVAIILFEGGLMLRFSRIAEIRNIVLRMVTIGALLTWALSTLAAWFILDFRLDVALLLGAVLVVTGPTVIVPLLRHMNLKPRVASLVRWEGIINDPVGAVLAVLVFQGIVAGGLGAATFEVIEGLALTLTVGTALAGVGAGILIVALDRYWVPDFLENPVTLALVVSVFAGANMVQQEAGLVAVTLMGIILANQQIVKVGHIVEFKENLRVLLISTLFIVLAARLDVETMMSLPERSVLFLLAIIFVVRPLAIFGSTIGTQLSWKSRLFVGLMAPRGIVAAAVASVFGFELAESGVPHAEQLLAEVFLVITGTVAFYGLTSRYIADWLDLSQPEPEGVVMAGSHSWALDIAEAIDSLGFDVEIIAQDPSDVEAAHRAGVRAHRGSAASHELVEELDLSGFGIFVALTATDEVNILADMEFSEAFGREHVYHLSPREGGPSEEETETEPAIASKPRGRVLFHEPVTYDDLDQFFRRGGHIRTITVTDGESFRDFCEYHDQVISMFYLRDEHLNVCSADHDFVPQQGDTVICGVKPA
jgi:NhaP-type Na+/H+ or K+/H+ antiporter